MHRSIFQFRLFLLCLPLFAAVPFLACDASVSSEPLPANLSGNWAGTLTCPDYSGLTDRLDTYLLVLEGEGPRLTGTLESAHDATDVEGVLASPGSRIRWYSEIEVSVDAEYAEPQILDVIVDDCLSYTFTDDTIPVVEGCDHISWAAKMFLDWDGEDTMTMPEAEGCEGSLTRVEGTGSIDFDPAEPTDGSRNVDACLEMWDAIFALECTIDSDPYVAASCGEYYRDPINDYQPYFQCAAERMSCDNGDLAYFIALNECEDLLPAPTCGNAFVESTEEPCDDGNLVDGDGCSGLCEVEAGYTESVYSLHYSSTEWFLYFFIDVPMGVTGTQEIVGVDSIYFSPFMLFDDSSFGWFWLTDTTCTMEITSACTAEDGTQCMGSLNECTVANDTGEEHTLSFEFRLSE
jgi:cysteine-rich repeat protein